jgi:hypothetical protein
MAPSYRWGTRRGGVAIGSAGPGHAAVPGNVGAEAANMAARPGHTAVGPLAGGAGGLGGRAKGSG